MISPLLRLGIASPELGKKVESVVLPPSHRELLAQAHPISLTVESELLRKKGWQGLLLDSTSAALVLYHEASFSEDQIADLTRYPTELLTQMIHAAFMGKMGSKCNRKRMGAIIGEKVTTADYNIPVNEFGKSGIKSVAATIEAAILVAQRDFPGDLEAQRRFVVKSLEFVKHWAGLEPTTDALVPAFLGTLATRNALIPGREVDPLILDIAKLEVHPELGCLSVRDDAYDDLDEPHRRFLETVNEGVGCPILPLIPRIYHTMLTHKLGPREVIGDDDA